MKSWPLAAAALFLLLGLAAAPPRPAPQAEAPPLWRL